MADFTLNSRRFPVGTTVGVYSYPGDTPLDGEPPGTRVTTAAVGADGTATFTGLSVDTRYWAAASVGGEWRWASFRTAPSIPAPQVVVSEDEPDGMTSGGVWLQPNDDGSLSIYYEDGT